MAKRGVVKGLKPGALKSAIEAHASAPSPLALSDSELSKIQVRFSTRGYEGLDEDALDAAVLHLWDVGACWDAWPDWAERRFAGMTRKGYFLATAEGPVLATGGVEAIAANAGRAVTDAAPRSCACVICAAAQLGRTVPMQFERGVSP